MENKSKSMRSRTKKLNICLLLPTRFNANMPARPAITEIYGNFLPSFGHNITWIVPSFEEGGIMEKSYEKVRVFTVPTQIRSFLIAKIINKIKYLYKKYILLKRLLNTEQFDIIQVRNSLLNALLVLHIKKQSVPFVFQYSFPQESFKLYKNHSEKAHLYYFGMFEEHFLEYVLRKADFIFPISKWMEKELIKGGIPKSKMMALPLGVNQELFSQNKGGTKIREEYNLNDAQIILYIGEMDKRRQSDIIIHAFSKVRNCRNNAKLLMVGSGDDRSNLEKLVSSLGIQKDVIFTGQVPYFDVPDYIAAADVCLCPVPPLSIYKISSPTKLFEYMVMNKPVVANEEIPEQKMVIEESGGGVLVKFEDESFAEEIIELLDNPERAKEMGRKGREWVVRNRSYENMAREVEKKYYELLESYNKG